MVQYLITAKDQQTVFCPLSMCSSRTAIAGKICVNPVRHPWFSHGGKSGKYCFFNVAEVHW